MNNQGGIGCGTWIIIAVIILVILGSLSSGGSSRSSYSSSGSSYSSQQLRDDYNYFKGRYDAMTGQ